jgi:hypothetical protein
MGMGGRQARGWKGIKCMKDSSVHGNLEGDSENKESPFNNIPQINWPVGIKKIVAAIQSKLKSQIMYGEKINANFLSDSKMTEPIKQALPVSDLRSRISEYLKNSITYSTREERA